MQNTNNNISQRSVAGLLGIKAGPLNQFLNGKRPFPKRIAAKMEIITGTSKCVWFCGSTKEIKKAWEDFRESRCGLCSPHKKEAVCQERRLQP